MFGKDKERTVRDDIKYHEDMARLESEPEAILDELNVIAAYEEIESVRAERKKGTVDTILKVLGGIGKVAFLGGLTIVGYMFETDNVNTRKGIAPAIRNTMNDIGFGRK